MTNPKLLDPRRSEPKGWRRSCALEIWNCYQGRFKRFGPCHSASSTSTSSARSEDSPSNHVVIEKGRVVWTGTSRGTGCGPDGKNGAIFRSDARG